MNRIPRIIAAFDTRQAWGRDYLQGVAAFADQHGPWDCDFTIYDPTSAHFLRRAAVADGIIARIRGHRAIAAVTKLKIPAVAIGVRNAGKFPRVYTDPVAIGRMAAEHLIERGFRRFAYCAFHGSQVAVLRGQAFVNALAAAGYPCVWFKLSGGEQTDAWRPDHAQLVAWVKKLPKPIAIFGVGDAAARDVASACKDAHISVPSQMAILGVDNDDLLCRLCSPQLSSIDAGAHAIGFEAARMLKRMLDGHPWPKNPTIVQPVRVVVRESSDIVAVEDAHVSAAVKYIRDHLPEGINVKQLVQHLPISRRALELAFRTHLGRTVHDEIILAKLHRAARLLVDGHMTLGEVAAQCGLDHPSRLNNLLKAHTGMTPMQYRTRHQRKHF